VINVNGYVTEDQIPADYVADPGTDDPVKLLRERTIQVRQLLATCDQLDAEIAKRDATIQELTIDLIQAEQRAAQALAPTQL
jgi:hypothetical protein